MDPTLPTAALRGCFANRALPKRQPRRARRCSTRPFRPLGYGNGKKESTTFSGWSNCYLGSNDPYGETLHSILSLVRAKYLSIDRFVSVVGSFVALQFLLVLKPKTVHFFDMNPQQVQWAKMLCELIQISKTPQEYISRVFARQVRPFERRLGHGGPTGDRLTHLNQHRFLRLPIAQRLRSDTLQRLSASAQETYQRVLIPLQEGDQPGWFTPTLLPCEDRRRLRTLARTGLGPQGRLPGDRCASLLYGEGWLSSQETFNVVKQKLSNTSITWTSDVDFTSASPSDIVPEEIPAESPRSLLFAMVNVATGKAAVPEPEAMANINKMCCDGAAQAAPPPATGATMASMDPGAALWRPCWGPRQKVAKPHSWQDFM